MSRLESPLGIRRRTVAGSVAGLGAALVLVGGSLSGLSDDIFHFRGWSDPSVADRGGAVGLAAQQPGTVADRRTGPAPAQTALAIVEAARALRGDAAQRASVRRVGTRTGTSRRRARRPGAAPGPAGPQTLAQVPAPPAPPAPPAAPAPAPAPAPASAPAQQAPAVVSTPVRRDTPTVPSTPTTPTTRVATPTRLAGKSGKVKPAKKKDLVRVSAPTGDTRTSTTATRVEEPQQAPARSHPGNGSSGQDAPGPQPKASSPGRGKHDRDHHGVGNVRGPGPGKR